MSRPVTTSTATSAAASAIAASATENSARPPVCTISDQAESVGLRLEIDMFSHFTARS